MPQPYGMRGGWRAVFTDGALEYAMTAGFTGQGQVSLTEHTAHGERQIELADTSPYAAMIDHVLGAPSMSARTSGVSRRRSSRRRG